MSVGIDGAYDSRPDTYQHIGEVQRRLLSVVVELLNRLREHDQSKLHDPEVSTFDRVTPLLEHTTYGSDEYEGFLADMGPALQHHYAVNRHHPEHGEQDPPLEWRAVPDYEEHYEVSNYGDVRSLERVVARTGPTGDTRKPGQIRKAHLTPKGYARIQLVADGVPRNHMVHVLVASAFIPNPDAKPEVNHKNGIKHDNRVGNLEWATSSENQLHAYETGLREPTCVVHCVELDVTTLGVQRMAEELHRRGIEKATAAGIWSAMDRSGKHLDLAFEGTALAEYRRSRLAQMNLVDVVEMLADWKAATLRHADGDLLSSITKNAGRFGYGEELTALLVNTARDFGWL